MICHRLHNSWPMPSAVEAGVTRKNSRMVDQIILLILLVSAVVISRFGKIFKNTVSKIEILVKFVQFVLKLM